MVSRSFQGQELLRALTAAGVKVDLTAFNTLESAKVLGTAIHGFDFTDGTWAKIGMVPTTNVNALNVQDTGSAGIPFQQEPTGKKELRVTPYGDQDILFPQSAAAGNPFVELRTGAIAYDARKPDPGIADTKAAGGAVTSPGAAATIVTLTPGTAGNWQIQLVAGVQGTTGIGDTQNMPFKKGGTTIVTLGNPTGAVASFGPFRLVLTAADVISIATSAAGTAGSRYIGTIIATLTG